MIGLLAISFFAGLIAGISPCVLPVLPVVFASWTVGSESETKESRLRQRRRRALLVVVGLVLSFSAYILAGRTLLTALHLPSDLLLDLGLVMIGLLGLGLLLSPLERLLSRPFRFFSRFAPNPQRGGFVVGLCLGVVYLPCAGPILAAITELGIKKRVDVTTVLVALLFSLGAAVPLLVLALAGDRLVERSVTLRRGARRFRPVSGVLLIFIAIAIPFNLLAGLQTSVPGYTNALQNFVERNAFATTQIRDLTHLHAPTPSKPVPGQPTIPGTLYSCVAGKPTLQVCGAAPSFTGISAWLNTPHRAALRMSHLRGRVVLIDFWTYSCINCLRALPHVESWYQRYHAFGLDIVGVHSPEFAFEQDVGNVRDAARSFGVTYPIAIDNALGTWDAYFNQYWPAEYLIDANGAVRHVEFGEGNYALSESLIRQLLRAAHPGVVLPTATNVPDRTPTTALTPETYLGYQRSQYNVGTPYVNDQSAPYQLPSDVPANYYSLGGTWIVHSQEATALTQATLRLNFTASHVYLVLGGSGSLKVRIAGHTKVIAVQGFPRLYTLVARPGAFSAVMTLTFSKDLRAYSFTFG